MNPNVQEILRKVTGFDLDKVFHTRLGETEPPKYKLLTDKELKEVFEVITVYCLKLFLQMCTLQLLIYQ